jgi:hypothetical protein
MQQRVLGPPHEGPGRWGCPRSTPEQIDAVSTRHIAVDPIGRHVTDLQREAFGNLQPRDLVSLPPCGTALLTWWQPSRPSSVDESSQCRRSRVDPSQARDRCEGSIRRDERLRTSVQGHGRQHGVECP